MVKLSRIRIHPVKSCRGFDVTAAKLDPLGLTGDRRFQVVNAQGQPFTQRSHGTMAQVTARYNEGILRISAPNLGQVLVPLEAQNQTTITTEVWSARNLVADDCGPEAGEFFSTLLGESAHLVGVGRRFNRPVKDHPAERVGFADAFPLLIIGEASLADLNRRLQDIGVAPVAMEQFRPNLIVSGCDAFAEDTWSLIKVGEIRFQSGGPCERCIMTTLDPATGAKLGPEPLRTLSRYRRDPNGNGVWFGQNLVNLSKSGSLRVNDTIHWD